MPKQIIQYSIFIASPGGLEDERKIFRDVLERCSANYGAEKNVRFQPVGWEDTVGGAGRPQAQINEDLRTCDFAVFVLHDRWGSPSGNGYTSGTEEEWELAEQLYRDKKIRNIALFFKDVDPRQLNDPGEQLQKVIAFKERIVSERKYLFKAFATTDQFRASLEAHLAHWLRDHGTAQLAYSQTSPGVESPPSGDDVPADPGFSFWMTEANKLNFKTASDQNSALFCLGKAEASARTDVEWAKARNMVGIVMAERGEGLVALEAFEEITQRFQSSLDCERQAWCAKALVNKGVTLGDLDRSADAIAVYDNVVARFGTAGELSLREEVAKALFNKGVTLGDLDRSEEEIAVYDDVDERFGEASESSLRERVAKALVNKGVTLGDLDRSEEAIAVYDDVVARFGTASELSLREEVARALVNKGVRLGALDRSADAIAVYDDVVARFGAAGELSLREEVAKALFNKGVTLGALDRSEDEIAVYDDVVARFGTAGELSLRETVARALFNKGVTLGDLDRSAEALAVYDDMGARFGDAEERTLTEIAEEASELRSVLMKAKRSKRKGKKT